MNRWTKVGMAAGGLLTAGALTVAGAGVAWRRATEQATTRLLRRAEEHGRARAGTVTPAFWYAELAELPEPVVRYFMFALRDGQPRVRTARIAWRGEFHASPTAAWTPFTAEQWFTVDPPGFVWDATMRMLPGVPMRVRDGYDGGEASMLGRVGGVATVVERRGRTTLARGALVRWLGEAVWMPTALLPTPGLPRSVSGDGVRWEPVSEHTARLVLTDRGHCVTAEVHFAPTGEITRIAAMRQRDVNGVDVPTPFEGVYGAYERREGMMVPSTAEVAWLLPEGRFAYWRGRVMKVEYETAR